MSKPPVEGSEDKYPEGSLLRSTYLLGREARMEGQELGANPYANDSKQRKAWSDGWEDENIWALDSTGR